MRRPALLTASACVALITFLFANACTDREPSAPDATGPATPTFNMSSEHRALVGLVEGEFFWLDASGEIVPVALTGREIVTQSAIGNVDLYVRFSVQNSTGRAVIWTIEDNPYVPVFGLIPCAFEGPDGNLYVVANWREVISASGTAFAHCWGVPIAVIPPA